MYWRGRVAGIEVEQCPSGHQEYYGPCPDPGEPPHHYTITVYALKVDHLDVPRTATPTYVDYLITSQALGKATIVRLLARPKSP